LVMVVSIMLIGVVGFNMLRVQNRTSVRESADTLVSDLASQQSKAMLGATEGRASADSYGVYFLSDQYVLFHGTSYNSNDITNYVVKLPSDLQFTGSTIPNNIIVFTALSGEILGFSPSGNTIAIKTINTNSQLTITINRYGVVTGVQ